MILFSQGNDPLTDITNLFMMNLYYYLGHGHVSIMTISLSWPFRERERERKRESEDLSWPFLNGHDKSLHFNPFSRNKSAKFFPSGERSSNRLFYAHFFFLRGTIRPQTSGGWACSPCGSSPSSLRFVLLHRKKWTSNKKKCKRQRKQEESSCDKESKSFLS